MFMAITATPIISYLILAAVLRYLTLRWLYVAEP